MAIAFARARYLSRASGGNAVRSAAYNAREAITAERTGELFHFGHRDAPEHHEVMLPEDTDARLADAAVLWNAAEAAERRKDAQVAREIVLALPADRVLSTEDRIKLARSFAQEHFVSKGLAVQLDVQAPHKDRGEGEGAWSKGTGGDHTNWHAHLLITTRRIEGDQFAAKKARDLDPEVRRAGTRTLVTDAEAWGETWRAHQDRHFQEHGIELRVDATAAHPGEHIGPVRMRKVDSPAVERAEALRTVNEAAAREPEQVLAVLTRNNATFTERELDRYLAKHLGPGPDGTPSAEQAQDIAAAKAAVMGHKDLLVLHDRETGEVAGRFSTRTVREQERMALTRQRESAQVFVAEDTARDVRQLARQMGRGEVRTASVAWATADELASELRHRAGEGQGAREAVRQASPAPAARADIRTGIADPSRTYWDQGADDPAQTAAAQPSAAKAGVGQEQRADGWLIAPYADPSGRGRDSLGRGTSPGEIAAVVAADKAVQREREARWSYLQGAYRDPHAARAALDELVKSQGWTSAAARVTADPLQLGELRGKEGLFAGAKARTEREAAQRAAGAVGPSLERIGEAEARAERTYRTGVDAQRTADATGIPRLSATAEVAIGVVAAASDEKARAEAWRTVQADERVAGELRAFGAAVEQRFGEEGVRAMLRAGERLSAVTVPSVTLSSSWSWTRWPS